MAQHYVTHRTTKLIEVVRVPVIDAVIRVPEDLQTLSHSTQAPHLSVLHNGKLALDRVPLCVPQNCAYGCASAIFTTYAYISFGVS